MFVIVILACRVCSLLEDTAFLYSFELTYLCRCGILLFVDGTEGFQGFSLPLSERDTIR